MKDLSLDLKIKNGDFELLSDEETVFQDQEIIISSDKGQILQDLLMGVGITKYLNGPVDITRLKNNIITELKKDNIQVESIKIINGEIYIKSRR